MAHNLEFNKEKQTVSFATAKTAAWHNLGQLVEQAMTTEQAIQLANLDFTVEKVPTYIKVGKTDILVPESYANVRTDNNAILGTVGEKYSILQNKDAFKFFDPILDQGEAIIETAGALGNGERIFITAKLPAHISILGKNDPIDQYLLITTSHDGKSATTVMFTPVRVVCNNTLNIALSGSKAPENRVTIKHTENQIKRLEYSHKILGIQNSYRIELEELFYKMADTKITEHDYESIIVQGLSDKSQMVKDYYDNDVKTSTRFKNNVNLVMEYAFTHPTQIMPSTNKTLFGAYNAVTGWYQNEAEWKTDDDKMKSIIDSNGRVNLKQQQTFEACMQFLNN
jgi:phage/plasmid-like protein (TIGR03299 family)